MISIISLLYYILIFYGVKYSCFGKFHDNFLSLKILNGLKGLASISILIGHMNLDHPEFRRTLFHTPPGLGRFYPAFFMFCSGYGLMVSFKKKKDYLNNFIKRRIFSILIPYLLNRFINYVQNITMNYNHEKSLIDILNFKMMFYDIFVYNHAWFILELIMFYLFFYIFFKYLKNRHLIRFLILIFCWLIILVPTYYPKNLGKNKKYIFVADEYHYSILSFIYGLLIGDYEENIIKFIKKFYYLFLILASLFPYYYQYFRKNIPDQTLKNSKYKNYWFNFTKYNILSILMYSCILIITMKIQINNIILDYLGKFTLENYLYHPLILKIYRTNTIYFKPENIFWKYFISFFISLYYSEKMHYINSLLIGLINKDENKIYENKGNVISKVKIDEKQQLLNKIEEKITI